jgi:hypothetical protein
MFGILFLILVLLALASIISNFAVRIRLTKRLPLDNKFGWWMESSDEVGRAYQELFPTSRLPSFLGYIFWVFIAASATVLLTGGLTHL